MTDLGAILGSAWSNTEATYINNAGDILGNGLDHNIQSAFELLWVPNAGATDSGRYIAESPHNVLAASAIPHAVELR